MLRRLFNKAVDDGDKMMLMITIMSTSSKSVTCTKVHQIKQCIEQEKL